MKHNVNSTPTMTKIPQTYIGDGIYIQSTNNWPLIITTGHHDPLHPDCNNSIRFEPEVLDALIRYLNKHFGDDTKSKT